LGTLVVKVYRPVEQLNPGGGGESPARCLPFASVGWETPLTGAYFVSSISHSTKSPSRRSAVDEGQEDAKGY